MRVVVLKLDPTPKKGFLVRCSYDTSTSTSTRTVPLAIFFEPVRLQTICSVRREF